MAQSLGERLPQGELKVVQAGDIVTALLRESRDADLIITGGTEAGMLEQLLGYALAAGAGRAHHRAGRHRV